MPTEKRSLLPPDFCACACDAGRARVLAHSRMPSMPSFIVTASGTISRADVIIPSVVRSLPASNASYSAATTTCSSSAPENSGVASMILSSAICCGSRFFFLRWISSTCLRSSFDGRSTKKISSKRPLRINSGGSARTSFAVAMTNTGAVFSCIHVTKVPNTREVVPPSVWPDDAVPEKPFSISSSHKTAEAIAPAVLWLDEMEKGFSGTGSSNMSDGGTTSRVFGTFVTWLQEKTSPVFVIATANDVRALPPELMRKGRFDEIFFVDLPSRDERKTIVEIHLKKKRRDPSAIDLAKVIDATPEFSGAELEQVVVSALYDAFDGGGDVTTDGLIGSAREIVPLAVTMKEGIDGMREWAKTRARPASVHKEVKRDRFKVEV